MEGENLTRFDVPGMYMDIWSDSTGIACEDYDTMAGCVLGGGTAVNAGMFFKPQDHDWDYNWPEGWQSSDMTDATESMFSRIPGTDTPSMDGKRYLQEVYNVLGTAVSTAGWTNLTEGINNMNNQKYKSFGHAPFMYSNGERGGPLATYLRTASARSNFKLQTDTMVRRVIRESGSATGVEVYATDDSVGVTGIYNLKAGGRVILSAGTLGTAKILMRSGIGPKDQLEIVAASALDGDSMIDESEWIISPVGYNVIDHTNTDVVLSHPDIVHYDFDTAYTNPPEADKELYFDSRSGVFSTASPGIPLVLYDQINGTDGILRQIQWTARAENSMGETGDNLLTMSQYLGTGTVTRGRIVITSSLDMTIDTKPYATSGPDREAVIQGVQNILDAIEAAGEVNGTAITVLQPASGQTAEDYVDSYAQDRGSNHWLGSARLGTDDGTQGNGTSGSVVDLNTKVYGTDNIFVVDASIFPGLPATNPSAPLLIAAEHAIKKILALSGTSNSTTSASAVATSASAVATSVKADNTTAAAAATTTAAAATTTAAAATTTAAAATTSAAAATTSAAAAGTTTAAAGTTTAAAGTTKAAAGTTTTKTTTTTTDTTTATAALGTSTNTRGGSSNTQTGSPNNGGAQTGTPRNGGGAQTNRGGSVAATTSKAAAGTAATTSKAAAGTAATTSTAAGAAATTVGHVSAPSPPLPCFSSC
jgi:cellobiose dehydrogenase (acceptor)